MSEYHLKSISKKQWGCIVIVFTTVVSLYWWGQAQLGLLGVNSDQFYYHVFTAKLSNPTLFLNDPVYADANIFKFYTPLFLALIAPFFKAFGFLNTLFIWQPVLAMGYLFACFIFLFKLTGRVGLSIFVALLSSQSLPIFPVDQWGIDSIGHVMPRSVFLVFSPLLFYGWWRYQEHPKMLFGLFFILGLLTNLHPVSGLTLFLPMLLAQLINQRFSFSALKTAFYCGLFTLLPVLPFAFNYFGHTDDGLNSTNISKALLLEALTYRIPAVTPRVFEVYYPLLLTPIGWWVLGLWSAFHTKKELPGLVALFCIAIILILTIWYGVNYLILVPHGYLPSLIDLVRVSKFLTLPLLWAMALWLSRFHRAALASRMLLVVFLTTLVNGYAFCQDVLNHPFSIQNTGRHFEHQFRHFLSSHGWRVKAGVKNEVAYYQALGKLAEWTRQHTPVTGTLIHVALPLPKSESMMVRALSQRSVTFSGKDGGLLYYVSKSMFLDWYVQAKHLEALHEKKGYCSTEEIDYAQTLHSTHLLCPETASLSLQPVYKTPHFSLYQLN